MATVNTAAVRIQSVSGGMGLMLTRPARWGKCDGVLGPEAPFVYGARRYTSFRPVSSFI